MTSVVFYFLLQMPPITIPEAVTLKEYLREWAQLHDDIHALQNSVIQERFAAMDKAIALQHKEYGRRLDELNHAHEQARQDFDRYLPRSTYDVFEKDFSVWKENFTKEHTSLMLRTAQAEEKLRGMATAVETLATRDANISGKVSGGALVVQYAGIVLGLVATMLAVGGIIGGLIK